MVRIDREMIKSDNEEFLAKMVGIKAVVVGHTDALTEMLDPLWTAISALRVIVDIDAAGLVAAAEQAEAHAMDKEEKIIDDAMDEEDERWAREREQARAQEAVRPPADEPEGQQDLVRRIAAREAACGAMIQRTVFVTTDFNTTYRLWLAGAGVVDPALSPERRAEMENLRAEIEHCVRELEAFMTQLRREMIIGTGALSLEDTLVSLAVTETRLGDAADAVEGIILLMRTAADVDNANGTPPATAAPYVDIVRLAASAEISRSGMNAALTPSAMTVTGRRVAVTGSTAYLVHVRAATSCLYDKAVRLGDNLTSEHAAAIRRAAASAEETLAVHDRAHGAMAHAIKVYDITEFAADKGEGVHYYYETANDISYAVHAVHETDTELIVRAKAAMVEAAAALHIRSPAVVAKLLDTANKNSIPRITIELQNHICDVEQEMETVRAIATHATVNDARAPLLISALEDYQAEIEAMFPVVDQLYFYQIQLSEI
jgi:hypothetical protein